MTLAYYGLAEPPFSITPDPRFVYLSERHRDALAHLRYGIGQGGGGGFVQLTGEVGTGKTTLSRLLLEQLPDDTRVALVLNPRLTPIELLETLCDELRIDLAGRRGSAKALVDALNAYLLDGYAQGLRVVLLVDEAQALPVDTLEQVRLLTNLETDAQKLLQVVLLGQPELRELLARDDLRQLAQRITARFHLTPLDEAETADYVRHRFRVAGGQRFPFTPRALRRLHRRSGGVPRVINVVAERALLAGYARDAQAIDEHLVDVAADEALPPGPGRATNARPLLLAAAAAVAAITIAFAALWPPGGGQRVALMPRAPQVDGSTTVPAVQAATPASTSPGRGGGSNAAARAIDADADALAARIDAAYASGGSAAAWSRLLQRWSLPAGDADAAAAATCARVIAPGVHCVRARATLDRLLALDRPVLLRLVHESRAVWALLQAADARHATLWLDGNSVRISRVVLDGFRDGAYAGLWRGPLSIDGPLRIGDTGDAVDWLRARLLPDAPQPAGAPMDAALALALRAFQRANGLGDDGIAGPETLFALAGTLPGPRLYSPAE